MNAGLRPESGSSKFGLTSSHPEFRPHVPVCIAASNPALRTSALGRLESTSSASSGPMTGHTSLKVRLRPATWSRVQPFPVADDETRTRVANWRRRNTTTAIRGAVGRSPSMALTILGASQEFGRVVIDLIVLPVRATSTGMSGSAPPAARSPSYGI